MIDKRTENSYRDLSLRLSMCNKMLKQIRDDLNRIKYPNKHRAILLHEKLQIEANVNSIRRSIRDIADSLDYSLIERLSA